MSEKGQELYSQALQVKALYRSGVICHKEALKCIQPYIDYYNATAERLAKKYNQRPRKFNFSSFMR